MTFYHSQNCSEYYLCLPDGQCNEAEDVVTTTGEQVSILHVVARCRIHWNLNNLVCVKSIVQLCVVEPVLKSDKKKKILNLVCFNCFFCQLLCHPAGPLTLNFVQEIQ